MSSNSYKYPKCNKFSKMPTENGICSTFNGLDLQKIFKNSRWTESFRDSFSVNSSSEQLKSEGIDLDEGLVFTLDTLQSYFITMKDRIMDQEDLNAFYIKVHPAGEIPWIKQDKSTWKKIEAYDNEISTKYITLKGEKVDSKDSFKEIPIKLRKCLFPDEGSLELFDYYTESNCKMECAWKKAKEICGCKPWYIPALDGEEMCFVLGNVCFDQIMNKIETKELEISCKCNKVNWAKNCLTNNFIITRQSQIV